MDWRQAFRRRLLADAGVAASARGVSWTVRPQDAAYPWLVLQVASEQQRQHLKGFFGRQEVRVQFDCLAPTHTAAVALRDAALAGAVAAGTFDGITFGRAVIEPRPDGGQQTETGFVHRISFDAIFWHN